jgi:hypothetical protein
LSGQAGARYHLSKEEIQILKTAALIHDMPHCFYWDKEKSKYRTDYEHAQKNGEAIYDIARSLITDQEKLTLLAAAVFFHMGIWGDKYNEQYGLYSDIFENGVELRNHPIVLAVQESDFYSTRRFINVVLTEEESQDDFR